MSSVQLLVRHSRRHRQTPRVFILRPRNSNLNQSSAKKTSPRLPLSASPRAPLSAPRLRCALRPAPSPLPAPASPDLDAAPPLLVSPGTIAEVCEFMKLAASEGGKVVPAGAM